MTRSLRFAGALALLVLGAACQERRLEVLPVDGAPKMASGSPKGSRSPIDGGSPTDSGGPTDNGGADAGTALASDGGPSITATLQPFPGVVVEFAGGAPIAGARICVVDHPDIMCATSGTDGTYTLSIPAWTTAVDFALNVTATSHLGVTELVHLVPNRAGGQQYPSQRLFDDATAAELLNQAGFAYPYDPDGNALVLLTVWRQSAPTGPATGMTVSSSPSGAGAVYLDATGVPDPTLTSISSYGQALLGNLRPGAIEVTVSETSCTPASYWTAENGDVSYFGMWADAKPATVAGVTVAGSITQVEIYCQ